MTVSLALEMSSSSSTAAVDFQCHVHLCLKENSYWVNEYLKYVFQKF